MSVLSLQFIAKTKTEGEIRLNLYALVFSLLERQIKVTQLVLKQLDGFDFKILIN